MDKTMYRLDGHMSYESSLSAVYFEYRPKKITFPLIHYLRTDGRTDGQTDRRRGIRKYRVSSLLTRMTTFIKAKLKNSERQTNEQ